MKLSGLRSITSMIEEGARVKVCTCICTCCASIDSLFMCNNCCEEQLLLIVHMSAC